MESFRLKQIKQIDTLEKLYLPSIRPILFEEGNNEKTGLNTGISGRHEHVPNRGHHRRAHQNSRLR